MSRLFSLKEAELQNPLTTTLAAVHDLYLSEWAGNLSGRTRDKREYDLREFRNWLRCEANMPVPLIRDVTPARIRKYLEYLADEEKSPATVASKLNSLKAFYREMCDRYGIPNPCRRISGPQIQPGAPKCWSPEQVELIRAEWPLKPPTPFLTLRNRAVFELLLGTGLRCHEVTSLDREQLEEDFSKLNDVVCKQSKVRDVLISPACAPVLERYLEAREHELLERDAVYADATLSRRGRYPLIISVWDRHVGDADSYRMDDRTLYRIVHDACINAGLPDRLASPHKARHTLAKALCDQYGIATAAQILGHSSTTVTMRYVQDSEESLREKLRGVCK